MQTFTNNAYGFLASGVSAVATTLVLGSGEGARFPTTSGDNFKVTLIALTNGQETAWEIVNVTGRSSDTLTVTRAQEGTTALVWPSLTRVELRLTAGATESKANLGTAAYKNIPASGNASATEVVYGSDTRLHVAATVADTASINLTLTGQQLSADAIFGTTATTVAAGNHNHSGVYEPADATILHASALGFSVQAYDTDLAAIAGLSTTGFIERTGTGTASTATVTAAGKALLDDADAATQRTTLGLGTAATMTGPSGTLVGTTDTQTLTNKTLSGALEVVGASVPATLSAANGGIQKFTLTTNWAGSDALTAGSSVLVMVKTTASYSFTPPTTVWTGGTAPTLSTTLFNCIEFWKVGTTLYGAWLGTVAS